MDPSPHDDDRPVVTVRYWASARAAAGCESDQVAAATVAEALDAVRVLHSESARFSDVVSVCSVLVGSSPVGTRDHKEVELREGDLVELLPPFAGG